MDINNDGVLNPNTNTKTFTAAQLAAMGLNLEPTKEEVDLSTYQAKIEQLTNEKAEAENNAKSLAAQLSASKAANYDLLNALPSNSTGDAGTPSNEGAPINSINDLFKGK